MRINKFIALGTGLSRRAADRAIQEGRVTVNGTAAELSTAITDSDTVTLDGTAVKAPSVTQTIMMNKPEGYVVSRDGQGSRTVYELLPEELQSLKPIGRLDKNSSGLLLFTNNGELAHQLTHPSFQKVKLYEVTLNSPLQPLHRQMISEMGVQLGDGYSKLGMERLRDGNDRDWRIIMHEGRNRQIRRTFAAVGYDVVRLHRTTFGAYTLDDIQPGKYKTIG